MPLRQAQHALTDGQRLAAIRQSLAEVGTADWTRVEDGGPDSGGGFVEATAEMGERIVLLRFDGVASDAEKQFVADAPATVRFLLSLVDRAIDRFKPSASSQPPAGPIHDARRNYAAEAAMKCDEAAFKVFLGERHGLEKPMTNERTAQRLRSLLGVTSRAELNSDDRAAAGWKKLRAEYAQWLKAERARP